MKLLLTSAGISNTSIRNALVDLLGKLHPHLNHEWFPENSMDNLETLAATLPMPSYAINDQTAIKVTNGTIEVVSEGNWKLS